MGKDERRSVTSVDCKLNPESSCFLSTPLCNIGHSIRCYSISLSPRDGDKHKAKPNISMTIGTNRGGHQATWNKITKPVLSLPCRSKLDLPLQLSEWNR